jgi:nucleoside phosphorylase
MATMETIGLIAAMSQESKALLRLIKEPQRIHPGTFRGVRFQIMERECVLVTSGMGLKCAADATRALLATANPRLLISFGIAGAVNADLDIGDVVAANSSYLMENGSIGEFRPLASLSEAAREAAAQALQAVGAQVVTGTTLTTRGSQAAPEGLEGLTTRCWKWRPPVLQKRRWRRASHCCRCARSATVHGHQSLSTLRQ